MSTCLNSYLDPCKMQTSSLLDTMSESLTVFQSYSIISKCQAVSSLAKPLSKWYRASIASNCSAIARWTGNVQGDHIESVLHLSR